MFPMDGHDSKVSPKPRKPRKSPEPRKPLSVRFPNGVPHDTWVPVTDLAAAEGCSRREVYWAIDNGLVHSRVGDRIRVRIGDWRAWHEAHVRGSSPLTRKAS